MVPAAPVLPCGLPGAAVHSSLVFSLSPRVLSSRASAASSWQMASMSGSSTVGGNSRISFTSPRPRMLRYGVPRHVCMLTPSSGPLLPPAALGKAPFPPAVPVPGGLCFPRGLCSTAGSAPRHPSVASSPRCCGPLAVKGAAASPPSRSLLPTCQRFAWVGDVSRRGLGWEFRYLFPSAEPVDRMFRRRGGRWLACGEMRLPVLLLELPQISRRAPGKPSDQFMT